MSISKPVLCCKDQAVLLLSIDDETGEVVDIDLVGDSRLLPIMLQDSDLTVSNVNAYFDKRRIPKNRDGLADAEELFHGFRESEQNRNMFSLTDQYWLMYNKRESWSKLNFFTNRYSQAPGRIFFEPWTITKEEAYLQSPDITTNGNLRKRWVQNEDLTSSLIKMPSMETTKSGLRQGPLCEVLASMLLEKIGFKDFVKYRFCIDGLSFCSKCDNFVTKDTEFVPMAHIFNKIPYDKKKSILAHMDMVSAKYGVKNAMRFLNNMIVADMYIGNYDRHIGNFGFIRYIGGAGSEELGGNEYPMGSIIGFAPIFDFGSAFWINAEAGLEPRAYRMISEKEREKACEKFFRKNRIEKPDLSDMFDIIDKYPFLPKEKRQEMKENISCCVAKMDQIQEKIQKMR